MFCFIKNIPLSLNVIEREAEKVLEKMFVIGVQFQVLGLQFKLETLEIGFY